MNKVAAINGILIACKEYTRSTLNVYEVFFERSFSLKLYSGSFHQVFSFCRDTLLYGCRDSKGTRSSSLPVRNAASFILPVPYVSDFSITAARYFTDNLRVANGVHNEAEMAWCSDGPRICLHSVPFPSALRLSVSEHAPFTPAFAFLATPGKKRDRLHVTIAARLTSPSPPSSCIKFSAIPYRH